MAKSKRNINVALTATKKKGKASKEKLLTQVQSCADKYARIFVFRIGNMRNSKLKELRTQLKSSRFFFGKNKVMSIALGQSAESEYKDNLHKVSSHLHGQCGLLFTDLPKEEILTFFEQFRGLEYARTGDIATESVELYAGPMKEFPHDIEPYLRGQLGMPTALQKGVVTLLKDFQVCKKGQQLTSEQARILVLLQMKTVEFRVKIDAMWSEGQFESYGNKKPSKQSTSKDDDDEEEELMSDDE